MGRIDTKNITCVPVKKGDLIYLENPVQSYFGCENRLRELTAHNGEGYTPYIIGTGYHADLTDLATIAVGKYVVLFLDRLGSVNGIGTSTNFSRHENVILTTLVVDSEMRIILFPMPQPMVDSSAYSAVNISGLSTAGFVPGLSLEMGVFVYNRTIAGIVNLYFLEIKNCLFMNFSAQAEIYVNCYGEVSNNIFAVSQDVEFAMSADGAFSANVCTYPNYTVPATTAEVSVENSDDGTWVIVDVAAFKFLDSVFNAFIKFSNCFLSAAGSAGAGKLTGYYSKRLAEKPHWDIHSDTYVDVKPVGSGNTYLARQLIINNKFLKDYEGGADPEGSQNFSVEISQEITTAVTSLRELKGVNYILSFKNHYQVPDSFKYFDYDDWLVVDRADILAKYSADGTRVQGFTFCDFKLYDPDGNVVDIREDENFFVALSGEGWAYGGACPANVIAYYNDEFYDTLFGGIPRGTMRHMVGSVFQILRPADTVEFRNAFNTRNSPLSASLTFTDMTRTYIIAG